MLDVAIGPLHFGAGEDQEIDTAWQPGTAPWDREMVLAGYNAFALDDFSSGQIVKYVSGGEDVAFQPQQLQYTNDLDQIQPIEDPQSVSAVVTDDTLYWTGAYGSDIDLKWHAQTARLDKRLIIQNLAALPAVQQFVIDGGNPVLRLQFIFQHSNGVTLFVDDVEWDEKANNPVETSGQVAFKNSSGDVLWSFNLPRSFDQSVERQFVGTFRFRKTGPNLFVEHLIPVSWLQTATYPVEIDVTVDDQVGTGADDGELYSTTTFKSDQASVEVGDFLGRNNNTYNNFASVTISNGSTIDVAYTSYRGSTGSSTVVTLKVVANDAAAPSVPTSAAEYDALVETTNNTAWEVAAWTAGVWADSPSIVDIIQELEDSYDYSSGSNILITEENNGSTNEAFRQPIHYETDTSLAAKLHIEYTAAGGANAPTGHILGPLYGPLGGPIAV